MEMSKKISHVIYDLDGLLLDTESLHAQVNAALARAHGKTFTKALKSKMTGRPSMESAQLAVETLSLPLTAKEYMDRRNEYLFELFPRAKPMPGAVRLTYHLYRHGIPQAVATSTARYPFSLKTSRHQEWFSIFDCVVLGDDPAVKRGKPAPDIFTVAAERLQAPPESCLVFEDSPAGVLAAKAAGMSVVVVPAADADRSLYPEETVFLSSLANIDPSVWSLPAFDSFEAS